MKKLGFSGVVHVVETLAEAKAYILGEEPYENRSRFPLPKLIVAGLDGIAHLKTSENAEQ